MFKEHYHKVKRQFKKTAKGTVTDHRIGLSFAIGTFITLLPISVFGVTVAFALSFLFRYLHKLSMFLGLLFWNGLVWGAVFIIPSLKVGRYVLGDSKPFEAIPYLGTILTNTQYYFTGISIIAIYMATLSYFVIRLLIKMYRLRIERRKILQQRSKLVAQ